MLRSDERSYSSELQYFQFSILSQFFVHWLGKSQTFCFNRWFGWERVTENFDQIISKLSKVVFWKQCLKIYIANCHYFLTYKVRLSFTQCINCLWLTYTGWFIHRSSTQIYSHPIMDVKIDFLPNIIDQIL